MFPLRLVICETCKHVQIGDAVSGERLFREYLYATSTSPVTVAHFHGYAKEIFERYALGNRDAFVVEVGSNDGTMLAGFKNVGVARVLGVDPAVNIAKKATEAGIPTLVSFFDLAVARSIVAEHGHADVVVANNVLAHAEDVATMLDGVEVLLAPNGLFVFEVSYLDGGHVRPRRLRHHLPRALLVPHPRAGPRGARAPRPRALRRAPADGAARTRLDPDLRPPRRA